MAIDFDIDALIGSAVATALVEDGLDPRLVAARMDTAPVAALASTPAHKSRNAPWTDEESAFVSDNLGHLSMEEIGADLGRSVAAIKVHWTRRGYAAPSKQPGDLSARLVGELLGMCSKIIKRLIREGVMPGRQIAGVQNIHVINRLHLLRWCSQPQNWIFFKVERIQDKGIKRLVEMRQAQWGDEWWTTGQVGRYHGVSHCLVNLHIRTGRLPGVRWQNWRVRKSDAVAHTFKTGSGSNTLIDWSPEGDAFILLATAVGLPVTIIEGLRKEPSPRVDFRLRSLRQTGQARRLIAAYKLPVQRKGQLLFVDWREVADRFPGLVRTIEKFLNTQRELSFVDRQYVRGVMRSWAQWYGLKKLAKHLRWAHAAKREKLMGFYGEMVAAGVDPFGDGEAL